MFKNPSNPKASCGAHLLTIEKGASFLVERAPLDHNKTGKCKEIPTTSDFKQKHKRIPGGGFALQFTEAQLSSFKVKLY